MALYFISDFVDERLLPLGSQAEFNDGCEESVLDYGGHLHSFFGGR
jgi:hypothetical protein